jgi:hypothetical protein
MVDVSVIVGDFNFMCVTIQPPEADSKLVIDANAVLPFSIAFKRFESITRWNAQIFNIDCSIQRFQLATSSLFDIRKRAYSLAVKQCSVSLSAKLLIMNLIAYRSTKSNKPVRNGLIQAQKNPP